MKASDYIGKMYEGRWQVVAFQKYNGRSSCGKFVLRNFWNGQEITLKDTTLKRVDSGEITISKVESHKIKKGLCNYKGRRWKW